MQRRPSTVSKRCVTTNPLARVRAKDGLRCYAFAWLHLYRRDFIGSARFIPGIYFEDYPFVISLLRTHPKTVILSDELYLYYNVRTDSIMNKCASAFTIKHIESYRIGLLAIVDAFCDAGDEDLKYIREKVVSNYLKQCFKKIRRSPRASQKPLLQAFAKMLIELKSRGMFCWRGHRVTNYIRYRYLMRRYSK